MFNLQLAILNLELAILNQALGTREYVLAIFNLEFAKKQNRSNGGNLAILNLELSIYTKFSTGSLKVRLGIFQCGIGNTKISIGI